MKLKPSFALVLLAGALLACDDSPSEQGSGLVGRVQLSGAPESGRIFTDQQFVLRATTYAPDNSLVTNAPITWSTSDSAIVRLESMTVDNQVLVQARRAGSATITVSSDGKKASVQLQVTEVPIATVRIDPNAVGLYPTMTAELRVVAIDSFGQDVSSRPTTWTTSNQQRVRVTDSGIITAVSAGEAVITATVSGKSATTTVVVLQPATSDWTQVTEDWVTYQGTALHTGYVPATVNPLQFRLKWNAQLFVGPVNPVVAAEGLVFVSGAIPSMHVVRALDAATGAQRWERRVGNTHSVNPPGYGDGNVYVQTGGHEDSYLHGFRAASGDSLFASRYENQWSRYFAPVVVGGMVYVAGGYYGGMYAFVGSSGARTWFRQLNQYDMFTPLVNNGIVYAHTGSYAPKLTAADAFTGAVLYEIPDPGFNWSGWSMNTSLTMTSPSTVVTAQHDRLLSFDLAARTIRWVVKGTAQYGQPTFANGVVYVANINKVEARRESDGSLLWTWDVPGAEQIFAPMVATRNVLFVSTNNTTYAVDLTARAHTWSYPAGGALTISKDGTLYIARADGTLTALALR